MNLAYGTFQTHSQHDNFLISLADNLALSSGFGAVAGGQMYDRTPQGWNSVIW
jgi:hypothetical protein